jgi:hypothetical protein
MHIFFTVKNTLVLLLMFYRLFVVFESKASSELDGDNAKNIEDYVELNESPVKKATYGSNNETKP